VQKGDFKIIERLNQIQGGNEAYLYKFQVSGIKGMEKPQVLRLFPRFYGNEKAEWEAMIQNLVSQHGVPAPKVYLHSSDSSILGGSFLVMDYVQGNVIDIGEDPDILLLVARTQSNLHKINGKQISEQIISLGHSTESHSIDGRLTWLLRRAEKHPDVTPYFDWLIENMPDEPENLFLIHGDFHPGNLLVKEGEVVAVLDWSGFIVGDPLAGLGWTTALFIATGKHTVSKEMFDKLLKMYHDEYSNFQPIDQVKLNYYIVFRLAQALLEGKDGQEFWTQPDIVDNIMGEIRERTGIY
jgi:aminoglycoside phosphotransferase (APT) family kinase protein